MYSVAYLYYPRNVYFYHMNISYFGRQESEMSTKLTTH